MSVTERSYVIDVCPTCRAMVEVTKGGTWCGTCGTITAEGIEVAPVAPYQGAVAALRDLLEVAEDMRPYVPDYFAKKWDHDAGLARARAALGGE